VGAGWVTSSDFWGMTPTELWWLYESKAPKDKNNPAGADWDAAYEALMNG